MRHIAVSIEDEELARVALAGARRAGSGEASRVSVLHVRPEGGDESGRGRVIAEIVASDLPGAEAHELEGADPVAAILAWAGEQAPDLIVAGAPSDSGGPKQLGAVTQAVLDAASCSVLVARSAPPQLAEYRHVGACVDLSDDTLAVIEEARPRVAEERALDLVHVAGAGDPDRRRTVGGLVRTLAHAVHGEPVVLDGDPATAILDWQRASGADLLVVAAGRHLAPARGIGQVAAAVSTRAECDVLVARCERPSGCVEAIPPAGMVAVDV